MILLHPKVLNQYNQKPTYFLGFVTILFYLCSPLMHDPHAQSNAIYTFYNTSSAILNLFPQPVLLNLSWCKAQEQFKRISLDDNLTGLIPSPAEHDTTDSAPFNLLFVFFCFHYDFFATRWWAWPLVNQNQFAMQEAIDNGLFIINTSTFTLQLTFTLHSTWL